MSSSYVIMQNSPSHAPPKPIGHDGLEPTHGTVQYGEMQHIIVHVLENGTGTDRAAFTDSVKVHYEGHLIPSPTYTAGYRFDASYTGTFSPVTSNPTILKISSLTDGFATAVMKPRLPLPDCPPSKRRCRTSAPW